MLLLFGPNRNNQRERERLFHDIRMTDDDGGGNDISIYCNYCCLTNFDLLNVFYIMLQVL